MSTKRAMQAQIVSAASIILFVGTWFAINNSFVISRDEMYYSYYAINETQAETDDIRYTTQEDLYTLTMLPPYRALQRSVIRLFGANIVGIRFLLIASGVGLLLSVWFSERRQPGSGAIVAIFTALLILDPKTQYYLHNGRPDWVVMAMAAAGFVLLYQFLRSGEKAPLLGASILVGLTPGLYWNGLAYCLGFAGVLAYLAGARRITTKQALGYVGVLSATAALVFALPVVLNWPVFLEVMQGDGLQTSDLSSGAAFLAWPRSLLLSLFYGTTLGIQVLHGGLFFVGVVLTIVLERRSALDEPISRLLVSFAIFASLFVASTALRGDTQGRSVNFVVPVLMYIVAHLLAIAWRERRNLNGLVKSAAIVVLLGWTAVAGGRTGLSALSNRGQQQAYARYARDVSELVGSAQGRMFTTMDFWLAFESYPKLFLEVTKDNTPALLEEVSDLFRQHDVQYAIVDERSRDRIRQQQTGLVPSDWYSHWYELMQTDYDLVGIVFNEYYRENKGEPPVDSRGFASEIWRRRD